MTEHRPPLGAASLAVSVTNGSQDALTKAFEAFLDEGEVLYTIQTPGFTIIYYGECLIHAGSSLLVEEPTYSGALAFLKPHGVKLVGIQTDGGEKYSYFLDAIIAGELIWFYHLYTLPTAYNTVSIRWDDTRIS